MIILNYIYNSIRTDEFVIIKITFILKLKSTVKRIFFNAIIVQYKYILFIFND